MNVGGHDYQLLPGLTLLNVSHDHSFLSLALLQGFWKPRVPGGLAQDGGGPPNWYQIEMGGRNEPLGIKPLKFLVTAV